LANRWMTYRGERYPLLQYVPLVAVFSFSAVSYSAALRGRTFAWQAWLVAFVTSLSMFLLLRIADEFKDAEDDARWRPYRPVPRGLVTLPELGRIAVVLLALQLAVSLLYHPGLAVLLLVLWAYFGLMSKEFFAVEWLRARPVAYLASHMLIMPLLDLYATACDWLPAQGGQHVTLVFFLVASFFNGIVIEVGRKVRCEQDEEEGVETYSFLWGRRTAVTVLLAAMAVTGVMAVLAAGVIGAALPVAAVLLVVFVVCLAVFVRFLAEPTHERARWFQPLSGLWTLTLYLSLGLAPLLAGRV